MVYERRRFSRQNRNGIDGFERKWIVMVSSGAREMRMTWRRREWRNEEAEGPVWNWRAAGIVSVIKKRGWS